MSPNPTPHTAPATATAGPAPIDKRNGAPRPIDELNEQGRRVQELVDQIGVLPDLAARALLEDCLQSVLAFHGQGLAQMLRVVQDADAAGQKGFDRLIQDSAVRGLLLIHGLHPVDLETRLRGALKKVRPYMESHGGNVELISLQNDMARLRLQGACKSCPSSSVTMELAVRQAIEEACPDLMGFEVEGAVETLPAEKTVPPAEPQPGPVAPAWTLLDGLGQLNNCEIKVIEAAGVPLLICKVNESLYAYRNGCAVCGRAFMARGLEEGLLKCPLGHRYDAQRAGACVDKPGFHLDPFPLLVENGGVKVAVR